jgi:hypothetical protein
MAGRGCLLLAGRGFAAERLAEFLGGGAQGIAVAGEDAEFDAVGIEGDG